ncbi:MAG: hypothetical protein SFY67_05145 [Candidatus Melainabacteria bacterium]|nr:hypothetical protein [Candidatus Melainabacteria bacterium]
MKVFYSWQSDLNGKTTRFFVRDCLEAAIKGLKKEPNVFDAERLELDYDTKNVPGTPTIVDTIFRKIQDSELFVADVSFVAESKTGRLIPNPNVLIELGYALHALGDERIILVFDKNTGSPESLPFDLRNKRFPCNFNSIDDNREKSKTDLVNQLKTSISAHLTFEDAKHQVNLFLFFATSKSTEVDCFSYKPEPPTVPQAMKKLEELKKSATKMGGEIAEDSLFKRYEKYFESSLNRYIQNHSNVVLMDLSVVSNDNRLIEDCDVVVTFPDSCKLMLEPIQPPADPSKVFQTKRASPPLMKPDGPIIEGQSVKFKLAKIKKSLAFKLPPFFLYIKPGIDSIEFKYLFVCSVPHAQAAGKIKVNLQRVCYL